MVRRPTRCRWLNPFEAHFGQVERADIVSLSRHV
jgi:hypothetical protein